MQKKFTKIFLTLSILFFLFTNITCVQSEAKKGAKAPDFKLNDLNGKWWTVSQFKGKKNIIIVAWIYTCPHCKNYLPKVREFYKKHKKDWTILSVTRANSIGDVEGIQQVVKMLKLNFPVLISSAEDSFTKYYKVKAVPTTWIISKKDFKIKAIYEGEQKDKDLTKLFLGAVK